MQPQLGMSSSMRDRRRRHDRTCLWIVPYGKDQYWVYRPSERGLAAEVVDDYCTS